MSTDTLEFPPIDEVAATPVAIAPAPPTLAVTDLAKVDLTDVALAKFGDWKADVATVRQNLSTLVLDLSTQAKVDDAKSLRQRLINQPRADVRKVSKALKSKLTAVSKAVGAMEEEAVAAYDDAELLITPQIDKRQAELDAEREEKARVERERVAGLQAELDAFQVWLDRCAEPGITAERIKAGMNALSQMELKREAWAEFYDRAINRRVQVLADMQALYERKLIAEHEERRLEEQRAEAARIDALLAARKAELDAREAEIMRQADELAAAKAAAIQSTTPPDSVGGQVDGCRAPESQPDGCSGPVPQDDTSLPASPFLPEDLGEPADTTGELRDQTDAEIAAADGPEVDLSPYNPDDFRLVGPPPVDEDTDDVPDDEGGIDVLLLDCLNLIDLLRQAYTGRFPSHPKPGPEFWADVRCRSENLQPRLLIAAALRKAVQ